MFTVHCEHCGRRSLLGWSRLIDVTEDHGVIAVTYRCYCGHVGQALTGRAHRRRSEVPVADPADALAGTC
jgi:hypothetical protein